MLGRLGGKIADRPQRFAPSAVPLDPIEKAAPGLQGCGAQRQGARQQTLVTQCRIAEEPRSRVRLNEQVHRKPPSGQKGDAVGRPDALDRLAVPSFRTGRRAAQPFSSAMP